MDISELQSVIQRELDTALGADGSKLSTERRQALEYYEGEPFGNEVDDRSQVVSRVVLETVEWILPALLRIFTASDKIAEIEPLRPDQEKAAEQATDYISYIFYRDNPGFQILHDWFKDALISKIGWVKCFWDTQEIVETNSYTGLSEQEYAALKTPDAEIVEEKSYPAPQSPFAEDSPDPQTPTLYDCTIKVRRTEGRVRIEPVPPEEVLTSRHAKTMGELPFVCHRREWTYTDLIEQGYDADSIDQIVGEEGAQYNTERIVRYETDDDFPFSTERTDKAMRSVWTEENYLRVDYDGDGVAELRKVVTGVSGKVVLTRKGEPDIELVDEIPLIPITPIPMPHKLTGMSVAELVMDLQLIKSTVMRGILDNAYLSNFPRMVVGDAAVNENTYDDLLTHRPGALVRVKGNGEGITPLEVPFFAEKMFPVLEYLDQAVEQRTGVARHNQGLNPDDLNKTATGVNLLQQAAAQRVELVARIFAETGVKKLVQHILGLVTRYQQHERIIRLTGRWVEMDPRQWRDSMDVTVSVGLGTGNRDQILQHIGAIIMAQNQIVMTQKGVSGPLVYAKNIYDALEILTENSGFRQSFFQDPTQPPPPGLSGPPQPPPPDPEIMKAQAKMQLDQQAAQIDAQHQQMRVQADMAADKAKAELALQLETMRAQHQMQLERDKAQHDMALEQMREQFKAQLQEKEINMRAAAGAYTPGPAPGAA